MILKSVTVRNFRIHRECHVTFDEARNVIGGPNESGKSTLMDAAHRALFLKARITGEAQRAMRSLHWPGNPEVEVVFQVEDVTYRVTKSFSGISGTTRLTIDGGRTWLGEEAEKILAEVLDAEDSRGSKGARQAMSKWSHIWVNQGASGSNPMEHAENHREELLQRLQKSGGAIVHQSSFDARVAEAIEKRFDEDFTTGGKIRAGSELQKVESALADARARLERAHADSQRLKTAADDLEAAIARKKEADQALPALSDARREASARRLTTDELSGQIVVKELRSTAATERYDTVFKEDERIRQLALSIEDTRTRIKPAETALADLRRQVEGSAATRKERETARQTASATARGLRTRMDLAQGYLDTFSAEQALQIQEKRSELIRQSQERLNAIQIELATIPNVKKKALATLEDLEARCAAQRARLAGMATHVELLSTNQNVQLGDETLKEGESRSISDVTELSVGDETRIRLTPGGGSTLEEMRYSLASDESDLQETCDRLGVASAREAREAMTRRAGLETERKTLEARIEEEDPETASDDLLGARTNLEAARAQVARLAGQIENAPPAPGSIAEAKAWMSEARLNLGIADAALEAAEAAYQESDEAYAALVEEFGEAEEELKGDRLHLQEEEAALKVLIETHGSDEVRAGILKALLDEKNREVRELGLLRESLADLQPEMIEADLERIERAIRQLEAAKSEAGIKEGTARAVLKMDGTTDPGEALAIAEAAYARTEANAEALRRTGDACRLLRDLFAAEQQRLAEQFTQPLAEKISEYLQCVVGAGARVAIGLDGQEISDLGVVRRDRGNVAIQFDDLSGGTREQVAVATRLAIAEILAEEGDGRLPIVLDDAFAYSDRGRIRNVQRMLDLAAKRGLQVIVLTCMPEDYTELGARVEMLSASPAGAGSLPVHSAVREEEETTVVAPPPSPGLASRPDGMDDLSEDCRTLFALLSPDTSRGNTSLRKELGWDEDRYWAAKENLVDRGLAIPGQGRGGSLRAGAR